MTTKEEHYNSMMLAVQRYAPNADMDLVERAYRYADEKHKSQLRKSGEPYIIHPLAVAEIVAEMGLDTDAIAAALLHDCLEDTDASFEELSRMFSHTIAELVEGVTKLTRVQYSTMEEQQMENLRKMFMAMSKDIRVILIKIADRLHNTRTLQFQTPAKQISKSMETMEIYAPLAHRLGMQKIKWELEDVSLQYLDPDGYQQIIDYLEKNEKSATSFMNAIQSKITDRLASVGIHGSIYGRVKHTYSIYRKMRAQKEPQLQVKPPHTPPASNSGVIVEDIGSCMIKFSRCCTPVPGDDIIGFITKGYGVSIHRKDCPNARQAADPAQSGRWVHVTWAEQPEALFSTSLELETTDRDGMMLDIATILTSLRVHITEMTARSLPGSVGLINLSFPVHNLTELESIRARLRGISGVTEVRRGAN